jgi:hypothetical protein
VWRRPSPIRSASNQCGGSHSTQLSHLQVSDAGGESGTTGLCVSTPGASHYEAECSVVVSVEESPSGPSLTNSPFSNGDGCGIHRGWTDGEVDLAATHTFDGLSGCDPSDVYSTDDLACVAGTCG